MNSKNNISHLSPARKTLSDIWLKASVVGGLWAAVEIIIGSFMHNLRIPFAGSILTAQGIMLLMAFYRMWPEKGLIWRAGLICALMKSISPSSVILGPMSGIFFEALLLETGIRIFGNNYAGFLLGGSLGMLSSLVHKVASLLILYGFNIVPIYKNFYLFLTRQVNISDANPWMLVWIFIIAYAVAGIIAVLIGLAIGIRSKKIISGNIDITDKSTQNKDIFSLSPGQKFNALLLYFHIIMIPGGLFMLNCLDIYLAIPVISTYLFFCVLNYPNSLRRLRKPIFWVQLIIIIILAGIFWAGFNTGGEIFNTDGLYIGLEMNLRAIFIVIAFSSLSIELRNPIVSRFLSRGRFSQLYYTLNLAFGALPSMMKGMPKPLQLIKNPVKWAATINAQADRWLRAFRKQSGLHS